MMLQNCSNRYFYVTLKANLHSIYKKGLIPQIGERSQELGEEVNRIYLFSNVEAMENALMNWLGEYFEEEEDLVILQMDFPDNFPIERVIDSNGDEFYEAYCYCNIPAQYITAVYDEEYTLLKESSGKSIDLDK